VPDADPRLPTSVAARHYDLELAPDLDQATFTGSVGIDLDVTDTTDTFCCNAAELEIHEVRLLVDGTEHAVEFELDDATERLDFRTPEPLIPGPIRIEISFSGVLNDRLRGFYRSTFTDEIEMDMSSWSGEPGGTIPADAWVAGVRAGLSGFDTTHHISANHVIDIAGDDARCTSYVLARHVLDGECYSLGGHYSNVLSRRRNDWKIARCRLTVTWTEGDFDLFARAAKRAEATRRDAPAETEIASSDPTENSRARESRGE